MSHDGFVNQRASIVRPRDRAWVSAAEAARLLGVKRATLYAYASRGLVRTAPATPDDRSRLYHRDDVERLRVRSLARAGHAPVAAAALRFGEPVLETRISEIRPDGPRYRGTSAVTLARDGATFEAVCALLWEGHFDDAPDDARSLRARVPQIRALLPRDAEPFDAVLLVASALAAAEPRSEASEETARARAGRLVRRLAAAPAVGAGPERVSNALDASSTARGLLVALGSRTTARAVAAVQEALVVTADHELNASTFAARIASSTGASLEACVLAALAVLSGPLHGAATARVEALVAEVARPERAASAVRSRLERGEALPGFGHPLYPDGDPRGARLIEVALALPGRSRGLRTLAAIVDTMDLVARERPTLDVGLVAVSLALGLPPGAPLALFATARTAGWIAHALEQRGGGHILRPRARYVGP